MRFVLDYYAPELRRRQLREGTPRRREGSLVIVLASFQDNELFFDRTNRVVGKLDFQRRLLREFETPQTKVGVPMSSRPWDVRLRRVTWQPVPTTISVRTRVRIMALIGLPLAVWYFGWLLNPDRIGTPYLYGLLIAAEIFNLIQAFGFWWTCANERVREPRPPSRRVAVDVFVPVYKEPTDIVDLTVAAAAGLRGAEVRVWVLDDGNDDAMRDLAARYGVGYIRREEHTGAKAGNINHALELTDAPFIAVFDSDHVADPSFLEATLGYMDDPKVAFVQTPQYYANGDTSRIAAAPGAAGTLFGAIARGKDGLDSVFCCGTNVLFRREAFESVGGFPTNSLTEDYELSIWLHEKGWKSSMCRTCCRAASVRRTWRPTSRSSSVARLPVRSAAGAAREASAEAQGAVRAVGLVLPLRLDRPDLHELPGDPLLTGGQPIDGIDAPEFLLHFAPYFAVALHGGARRRRLVHVRGVRAGRGELLDPLPGDGVHGAGARAARSWSRPRRARRPASRRRSCRARRGGRAGRGEHLRARARAGRARSTTSALPPFTCRS